MKSIFKIMTFVIGMTTYSYSYATILEISHNRTNSTDSSVTLQASIVTTKQHLRPDTIRTYQLGEVIITGSNHATGRNLQPYSINTIKSIQIEATGQSQLLSAISGRVPSLFVTERNIFGFGLSNGGSGGIKIRGIGGSPTNAILMMVDGQPQFAGIYSHHIADFYETEYVNQVEVLRGPASVLYGSNAMGGVINIITKNTSKEGVHTTLSSQYGSYNTWHSSLSNTTHSKKFFSLVTLGYDYTDGTQNHFDFKQKSLYTKIGYDINNQWRILADYSLINFIGNDPIYPKLSSPESTEIYHQNITRGETSLSLHNYYGNTIGNICIYYSYGNHFIDDPNHFHSLDDRFGILAYQNFCPWMEATTTLGFDFNTYTGKIPISGGHTYGDGSTIAQMQTINRKSITEYSPYITLSQSLFNGILILNAGLRMANSNRFITQWIPQGGIVIHPTKNWTLKASIAKGYRNPSFREMYLYRTANPDLEPENMINYEITLSKIHSHYFSIDVTSYFSEGSSMIQTVDMKNENTGSFTNKGIEVSASSQPSNKLTLHAAYSYLYSSLNNLTAAPKNQYYLSIGWQAFPKFNIDAELRNIGGLYVSDDMKHQNYTLLNMKLTYKAMRILEIFASFDNITNTRYTINRGYEMPGFTAMSGFKLHF